MRSQAEFQNMPLIVFTNGYLANVVHEALSAAQHFSINEVDRICTK